MPFERVCHEEKITDVNIATELLLDAFDDIFDTAIVVSRDSDLSPLIRAIRQRFAHKRVVMAFPPRRHSSQLEQVASAYFQVNRAKLAQSQLPDRVTLPNGHIVTRPPKWR